MFGENHYKKLKLQYSFEINQKHNMKPSKDKYLSAQGQYSRQGGSPLRQKSNEPVPYYQSVRPQRIPAIAGPTSSHSRSGLDLRKQIQLKERELAKMIQNAQEVASRVKKPRKVSMKRGESLTKPKRQSRPDSFALQIQAGKIVPNSKGSIRASKRSNKRAESKKSSSKASVRHAPLRDHSGSQSRYSAIKLQKQTSPLRFHIPQKTDLTKSVNNLPPLDKSYQSMPNIRPRQYETIKYQQTSPPPYQEASPPYQQTSPLRDKQSHSRSRSPHAVQPIIHAAFQVEIPERDTRPDYPEKQERQSPLRVKLIPVQESSSQVELKTILKPPTSHNKTFSHIDRLNSLSADIIRFRRKIDQVRLDIDLINKQKQDLLTKLDLRKQESNDFSHIINKQDVNDEFEGNSLHQKINFEKHENEKLHERIHMINSQKNNVNDEITNIINQTIHKDSLAKRIDLEMDKAQSTIQLMDNQNQGVLDQTVGLDDSIRSMTRQQLDLYRELKELESQREIKAAERLRLQGDLAVVTKKFIDIKSATNDDHRSLFEDGDQYCKLIASRILFNLVHILASNSKQRGFNEIRIFSDFDAKCTNGLKKLSRIMGRVGNQKMRTGLELWYENTLKPIDLKFNNDEIAIKAFGGDLMGRVFQAWKKQTLKKHDVYKGKTDSITIIWTKFNQNMLEEQKRYFAIWKEKTVYVENRKRKVKRILTNSYRHHIENSFYTWKHYSQIVMHQVRLTILKREYAQRFFLNSVFQKFKMQVATKRLEKWRLKHYSFKGWQDYIAYKKFIFHQNLVAHKFIQANTKFRLQSCFDALRNHREFNKYAILDQALREDMDIEIGQYTSHAKAVLAKSKRSEKRKCVFTVRDQMAKRLFSYFNNWKQKQACVETSVSKNVSGLIISTYRQYLRAYFELWHKNSSKKVMKKKKKMIMQLQESSSVLENEAIANENTKKVHVEEVRSVQNKQQNKILKKFAKRVYENAFNRWRDQIEEKNKFQGKTERILKRCRKMLMQQAWSKYKEWLYKQQNFDECSKESEELTYRWELKRAQHCFDNWKIYVQTLIKARKYWGRIFYRKNTHTLRRIMKQWKENANIKKIYDLRLAQNKNMRTIDKRNTKLTEDENTIKQGDKQIEKLNEILKKKAHKLMGNYLMRYYSENTEMRFKAWKELSQSQRHKEKLVLRMMKHYNMAKMNAVRGAFKSFVTQEVQKQKRDAIQYVNNQCDSEISMIKQSEVVISKDRKRAKEKMVKSNNKQAFKKKRFDKTLKVIDRRATALVFSSIKRKCFEALRDMGKQDRAFMMAVSNVLTKSMTNKGFEYIKEHSRDNHADRRKYHLIKLMIVRFLGRNVGEYFLNWKDACRIKVNKRYRICRRDYTETVDYFTTKIKNIKTQNTSNVEHMFVKRWIKRIWVGWNEEIQTKKKLRIASEEFKGVTAAMAHTRGIQKWWHRWELTKRLRFNHKARDDNYNFRMKRAVWDAIWARRAITRKLCQSLCNFEKEYADYHKMSGVRVLKSYNNTKKHGAEKQKSISLENIGSILCHRNQIILKRYFRQYRAIVKNKNHKGSHVRKIMLKMMNANLRWGFDAWRHANRKEMDTQELNEVGPVTEQVFEAKRAIKNLQDFMESEKFTKEEIAEWMERVNATNEHQMMKLCKRLKIPKGDRIMTRAFDHWVFWIKIKRLFKYHMRSSNDRLEPVKCDLRWAFNMWKLNDFQYREQLSRANLVKLQYKNLMQTDQLSKLANSEARNQLQLGYLSEQRNKLLDHNLRAKRKALSLLHDNYLKDLRQAWMKWKLWRDAHAKYDGQLIVARNNQIIVKLKERINEFELENGNLVIENEELRNFSIEGFEIANTVKELDSEKNRLQANLDDEDDMMNDLLRQQEDIRSKLRALGAEDSLGFDPNSKFLDQTFIKSYKDGKGGAITMQGVVRDSSLSQIVDEDKENYEIPVQPN